MNTIVITVAVSITLIYLIGYTIYQKRNRKKQEVKDDFEVKRQVNNQRIAILTKLEKLKAECPFLQDQIDFDIRIFNLRIDLMTSPIDTTNKITSNIPSLRKSYKKIDVLSNGIREDFSTIRLRGFLEISREKLTRLVNYTTNQKETPYPMGQVTMQSLSLIVKISRDIDKDRKTIEKLLIEADYCAFRLYHFMKTKN